MKKQEVPIFILEDKTLLSRSWDRSLAKHVLKLSASDLSLVEQVTTAFANHDGTILNRDGTAFKMDTPTIKMLFSAEIAKELELRLIRKASNIKDESPSIAELPLLRLLHIFIQILALSRLRKKAA